MLAKLLDKLTSGRALAIIGTLVVAWWTLAYVVYFSEVRTPLRADGHLVGGDWVSFHTGATIVWQSQGARLYDPATQFEVQRTAVGAGPEYLHGPYVNPPTLAILLSPLADLPYIAGFHIYTGLMLLAFALTMWSIRGEIPNLSQHRWAVVLLSLGFFPIVKTITGGQNTVLSLLLLTGAYVALRRRQQVRAGLMLGLLLFKPHFAAVLLGLLVLRRCWTVVTVAGLVGIGHYLIGAIVCGPAWPAAMLAEIQRYLPSDFAHNGSTAISWLGVAAYSLPSGLANPIGCMVAAVTILALIIAWRRADPTAPTFGLLYGMTVCGTLLISPHTQFYDAGLVLLPALLALEHLAANRRIPSRRARLLLVLGFGIFALFRVAEQIGFQPLLLWPLLTGVWCLRLWLANDTDHLGRDSGVREWPGRPATC